MTIMSVLKITILITCFNLAFSEDLYDTLGISRHSSTQEIKVAYKKLAKEWHPDKNKDPEAMDRFTKINEAYETLSDPDRRRDYDNFGYTTAQERPQHRQPNFQHIFPFEEFFGDFGFAGGRQSESIIDKYTTTFRNFQTKLQPNSHYTPCFVYGYSDFCFNCMRMAHLLEKLFAEMENVGLCVATFHVRHAPDLAGHLAIHTVPALMGMINGRITHVKAEMISLPSLRDFVHSLFPKNTLIKLTDGMTAKFLESWRNNQMSAIFFSPRLEPSARFLAPAFFHRDRVAFAYVSTSANDAKTLMAEFNINKRRETLLMFNEETTVPVATVSMQQLSRSTLEEVITSNRFLQLPRLSSQSVFEELCPREPRIKHRKFCVALVTSKNPEHEIHQERFRHFAHSLASVLKASRVHFVYVYQEVQQKFIQALTKGNTTRTDTILEIVILWRTDDRRVSYEFLEQGWSLDSAGLDQSQAALKKRLLELLESDHLLPYWATVPDFYNEHALSLAKRMLYKILDWGDRIWFFVAGYHPSTWFMTLMAIVVIVILSYVMKKMADAEEAQIRSKQKLKRKHSRPPSSTPDNQTIHLYEVRSETFNKLVTDADTGLTVVVLINEESREQLLRNFAEIMQPYSRYSALTFGFIQLEYYISWYQHLLEMSMSFRIKLDSINMHNCIGTVLALNGYRKYYYIYHPRRAQKWIRSQSKIGHAMGFADSDSDSEEARGGDSEKLFINELLSGLAIWMDRIFDGSVRKVRLDYWPEMCQ